MRCLWFAGRKRRVSSQVSASNCQEHLGLLHCHFQHTGFCCTGPERIDVAYRDRAAILAGAIHKISWEKWHVCHAEIDQGHERVPQRCHQGVSHKKLPIRWQGQNRHRTRGCFHMPSPVNPVWFFHSKGLEDEWCIDIVTDVAPGADCYGCAIPWYRCARCDPRHVLRWPKNAPLQLFNWWVRRPLTMLAVFDPVRWWTTSFQWATAAMGSRTLRRTCTASGGLEGKVSCTSSLSVHRFEHGSSHSAQVWSQRRGSESGLPEGSPSSRKHSKAWVGLRLMLKYQGSGISGLGDLVWNLIICIHLHSWCSSFSELASFYKCKMTQLSGDCEALGFVRPQCSQGYFMFVHSHSFATSIQWPQERHVSPLARRWKLCWRA